MTDSSHNIDEKRTSGNRRADDTKVAKIHTDVEILNYKVDAVFSELESMRNILARQTELFSTFAIIQDRQISLTERVKNIEEKNETKSESDVTIAKQIQHINTGLKIAGFLYPTIIAIFGFWAQHDIAAHESIIQRQSVTETRLDSIQNKK